MRQLCANSIPTRQRVIKPMSTDELFDICACSYMYDHADNGVMQSDGVAVTGVKSDASATNSNSNNNNDEGGEIDVMAAMLQTHLLFGSESVSFVYFPDPLAYRKRHVIVCDRYFSWVIIRQSVYAKSMKVVELDMKHPEHITLTAEDIHEIVRDQTSRRTAASCEEGVSTLGLLMMSPAGCVAHAHEQSPRLKFDSLSGFDITSTCIPDCISYQHLRFPVLNNVNDDDAQTYMYNETHPFHEAWMLVIWSKRFMSATGVDFIPNFVVFDFELFNKRKSIYSTSVNNCRRYPLIIQCDEVWLLQFPVRVNNKWIQCDNLSDFEYKCNSTTYPISTDELKSIINPDGNESMYPFLVCVCDGLYDAISQWLYVVSMLYNRTLFGGSSINLIFSVIESKYMDNQYKPKK
jgi:hypothetical protein